MTSNTKETTDTTNILAKESSVSSLDDHMAHMAITAKQAHEMTVEEKYTLITRNVQEVLQADSIKKVLEERSFSLYWVCPLIKTIIGIQTDD
jgi:predicted metalloprotease with PDZ domain